MPTYYCQLGSTPDLSLAELTALGFDPKTVAPHVAKIELPSDQEAQILQDKTGGIVKIVKAEQTLAKPSVEELQTAVIDYLAQQGQKVAFGLAEWGRDHLPVLSTTLIKNELMKMGLKARYREDSRSGLSAAVLLHKKSLIEVVIIQDTDQAVIGKTVAVQNIDEWTVRDRMKPYFDRKKGMLPPKVARMMVNLALGQYPDQKPLIYDPFCGSGTILIEGLLSDVPVVGSDVDPAAADGSRRNLEWLQTVADSKLFPSKVFQADVTHVVPQQIGKEKVDAIVTEPFLGKPSPNPAQLTHIHKGLEKLYLGAFKQWTKLLKPGAVIVMVLPVFEANPGLKWTGLIDKIKSFGYTMHSEPVLYHRPQAVVQRQITTFIYQAP